MRPPHACNSSFIYKGKAVDIEQAGRELGVRYLLEGSVRKAGGKLRITGHRCLRPASVPTSVPGPVSIPAVYPERPDGRGRARPERLRRSIEGYQNAGTPADWWRLVAFRVYLDQFDSQGIMNGCRLSA